MSVFSGGPVRAVTTFDARYLSTGGMTNAATTEMSLISSGVGSMSIPANWAVAGSTARLIVRGLLTTPALSLGVSTFRFKTGGTTRVTAQTLNLLGGVTNVGFVAYQTISFRTVGASGTAVCAGELRYPSGGLAQRAVVDMIQPTPFAIDTTSEITLDLTAQWSLSGHSLTTVTTTLELLSPTSAG